MSPIPEPRNDDVNQDHDSQTYEIRYLAKYSSYEFRLAVPRPSPARPSSEPSVVRLRFKDPQSLHSVVLSVDEFEAFYDALSRLVEYIRREHEARK
jgi:hypothetical protein